MVFRRARFRVIGYVSSAFGLGIAASNTVRLLLDGRRKTGIVDVDPGLERSGRDETHAALRDSVKDRRSVNIFQMNPPEIVRFQRQWRNRLDLSRGLNACVPFWELPHVPAEWIEILQAMDVVLAPTRFIQTACDEVLDRPSIVYPQTVFVPESVAVDRERWGFSEGQCVFLVAFDVESDLERKNPRAAIEAFTRAFGDDSRALLAIKVNRARLTGDQSAVLDSLRERVAPRPNITLIEDHLSYDDVLSLYASCDVMVSTHRAEGLGLHLMEAMSLGRAVLATGWSGNMDFMTADNSALLPYRLVPVESRHANYAPEAAAHDQLWAEPDLDAISETMARLEASPELRTRLGERAAADMKARRHQVARGEVFDELADRLRKPRSAETRRHLAAFRVRLREAHLADPNDPEDPGPVEAATVATKRWIVQTLRRLGLYPPA